MTQEASVAWAAGLFEGEGSIVQIADSRVHFAASMNSTDEDVLQRFHLVLGVGHINGPYNYTSHVGREHYKEFWSWAVSEYAEFRRFCELMMPWMGARRLAKMQDAYLRIEAPARPYVESRERAIRIRSLLAQGSGQSEIARIEGVSRQRVSYLAKNLERDTK